MDWIDLLNKMFGRPYEVFVEDYFESYLKKDDGKLLKEFVDEFVCL